ncbi:MAG: BatD family protein [Chthoniobacterales bacterium]
MTDLSRRLMLWAAVLLALGAASAVAEVTTILSSNTARVGEPVMLVYRFVNTEQPRDMPRPRIAVAGLDIRFNGVSSQSRQSFVFGGRGTQRDAATVYEFRYTVVPNQPGRFTIPGFAVSAGGRQIRTQPAQLTVTGPGGSVPPAQPPPVRQVIPPPFSPGQPQQLPPPQQGGRSPATPPTSQGRTPPLTPDGEPAPYFGEIIIGSKSAYAGEVVPVELRFHYRADIAFDNLQPPSFGGDGFTAAPLTEPEQTEQILGNIPYNVVTFRSAITPVKPGEIEIPAAVMEGRMVMQGAMPGMDPFFDQFFRNFPMPGIGRAENIQARTESRTLQVQPLPREGRPANFTGAIGQFTLQASAAPDEVAAGEPVTLSLALEGRGNFEAIPAPSLTGEDGWRVYAPKDTFTAADAIGYGGTKTFEISMVARRDQTATPGAEFSYFDPQKKKYFTLTTKPQAVTAAGGGAETDEASSTAQAATDGEESGAPAVPDDIAKPAPALAGSGQGFLPRLLQPSFHWINLALLAAVILSIPYLVWQRRRARKSALTAETEAALREAKAAYHKASAPADFYAAAAQFVQARLALLDGKPVALVDPDEALARRVPDAAERQELQSMLARRDELKYGGSAADALDPAERRRMSAVLDNFASNHA